MSTNKNAEYKEYDFNKRRLRKVPNEMHKEIEELIDKRNSIKKEIDKQIKLLFRYHPDIKNQLDELNNQLKILPSERDIQRKYGITPIILERRETVNGDIVDVICKDFLSIKALSIFAYNSFRRELSSKIIWKLAALKCTVNSAAVTPDQIGSVFRSSKSNGTILIDEKTGDAISTDKKSEEKLKL